MLGVKAVSLAVMASDSVAGGGITVVSPMQFSQVLHNFQCKELEKLNIAFNAAWPPLLLTNGSSTPFQVELLKKRLAQHIVACASIGQLDPERLKEESLRALLKRHHNSRTEGR
jgi:hypothetical protein